MFTVSLIKTDDLWSKITNIKNSNQVVRTGFFPESSYGPENDNLPVAEVARFNEEGTITNPVRPFMRVGFALPLEKGKYDNLFQTTIGRILDGKSTFAQEYKILTAVFEEDMKKSILSWSTPPNSPRTVAEKGFNDPLIDSKTMLNEVKSKVEAE